MAVSNAEISMAELLHWLRSRIADAIDYAKRRQARFRRSAVVLRMTTLALSGIATVILGLQDLSLWASLAFSLVALTTVLGAVEPFFNWRSRWVLMEEMQGKLHRLDTDLEYFLAKTEPASLSPADLDPYYDRLRDTWEETSRAWIEFRKADKG